jgi:hypothetical protein
MRAGQVSLLVNWVQVNVMETRNIKIHLQNQTKNGRSEDQVLMK